MSYPIYLSWKQQYINNRLKYMTYGIAQLLKLLTTYNLHSATEVYKNCTDRNISSFMHKHTNNHFTLHIACRRHLCKHEKCGTWAWPITAELNGWANFGPLWPVKQNASQHGGRQKRTTRPGPGQLGQAKRTYP